MRNLYKLLLGLLLLCATQLHAQVPVLNSYPSAAPVIFLDFDGHYVNGTSWNTNGPLTLGPSNLNATQITEVFNRVAEDYRPFTVNITTDSTVYLKAPIAQRMRVVLTITWEWYGRAGGVAYTGSFTWGDNTPCFIFTSLHNYNVKNISEAAAHEAGHTLGLRHQARYDTTCAKTEEYNSGIGTGEVSWAPIMGVGYYRNQTTWHNGPNPYGCTNAQDDIAIITSRANGITFRTDDHPNDPKKATKLTITSNLFKNKGVITSSSDIDMFALDVPKTSNVKLKVSPVSVGANDNGSNLDAEIKLYNSKSQLISTYNQPELLSAALDTTLSGGSYFVTVEGTSNQYASSYASVGEYSVDGSISDPTTFSTLPLHQLEIKGTADGDKHKVSWIIDADEKIVTQILEASANGRTFEPVLNAATDVRSYTYQPATNGTLQYRINVTFDDGKQYYSNIIAVRSNANSQKRQLFTNIIRSNAVMVSSPATYNYTITDLSGKQVSMGKIAQGSSTINTPFLTTGLYIIRFSNGSNQFVEKFTRQ